MSSFTYIPATKTLELIESTMQQDQGASFREWEGRVLPHIGDAYRGSDDAFRSHLGASVMGKECARDIWYGYRWTTRPHFKGSTLRLFNRGHLEEGRFIALLLMIGCEVWQQDENGKQFRISHRNGLFGGSGDGIARGIPDLAPDQRCVLEFKTHNDNSFKSLAQKGVKESKYEHYVQMQIYMYKMGIPVALYCAVNKNNDQIHMEIIRLETEAAEEFICRAERIIDAEVAPRRINNSPGYYKCRFCDHRPTCHLGADPDRNCRTCQHGKIVDDKWTCALYNVQLVKTEAFDPQKGCVSYVKSDVY